MFSCGWAKTIRIRQRILRKYSEVRKNTHYCVGHGKALEFLSISLRDTVPIMHTREERLFFFPQKDLSRFCRSLGRLATLKASSTRLTAFVKVNSSQRSICGTSQHYPLCEYWHIRPSQSLSTFLGWLLWISLRPVIPILLSFFLFFSTVRLQLVFGLPLLLFPSGAQVIAVFQSLFWSCISICPIMSDSLIYAVSPFYSESNR